VKVGDVVICTCAVDTEYSGVPGILVGFTPWTHDPMVLFSSVGVICLARSSLEVVT